MTQSITASRPIRIAGAGHVLLAVTYSGLGVFGLIKGDFPPVWDSVPANVPARLALVYLCAVLSLASGVGLLVPRAAALAARVLFACLLLWMLLFRLPQVILSPTFGVFWPAFVTAAVLAGAWTLYIHLADDWDRLRLGFLTGDKGLRIARAVYALALFFFGAAHFIDPHDTLTLEPAWLPWHVFWAYFFGCTFIAAGLAVLTNLFARVAAALTTLQLALFTCLVWVPMIAAGSKDAFVWSETILSAALTANAWVVADSYRALPWLAFPKRK
jgi:uncharacterized membrane protein